jgi:sugar/nucleoside kinase (ribokinase family)
VSAGYDYVAIGHVTVDVIEDHPDGRRSQPGGGAFYSALQAARLGLRSLIVTKGLPTEIQNMLAPYREELDVHVIPSQSTTTLATWGSGRARFQCVRAWAGPIDEPLAGLLEAQPAIVHFAPVARETTAQTSLRGAFVGLTPQGLVRRWEADGRIRSSALEPDMLPQRVDAAVLSAGERPACAALLERAPDANAAVVAVTAGVEPIELRLADGRMTRIPAVAVEGVRDDLGAGDVFAAAFFVALRGGEPAPDAARFASAAAAVKLAGVGPAAIGRAQDVERRLADLDG